MTISLSNVAALSVACCLVACTGSSGVYSIAPDTYRVAKREWTDFGGEAAAKGEAYEAATASCTQQGKQLKVTDESADAEFTGATVTVTFNCVAIAAK